MRQFTIFFIRVIFLQLDPYQTHTTKSNLLFIILKKCKLNFKIKKNILFSGRNMNVAMAEAVDGAQAMVVCASQA